jgi:CubicO group peptidase (beta-lactamase class C family)
LSVRDGKYVWQYFYLFRINGDVIKVRELKFLIVPALVFMLAGSNGFAQTAPKSKAPKEVAAELGGKLDELLSRYARYGLSGTVLVAKGGRIVVNKGYGQANKERGIPNRVNTVFDVASITKTFTAAAILQLEMAGKLRTDDRISKYLGEFPKDKTDITIHHLLTHTAGFKLDASDAGVTAADDREAFLQKIKVVPLSSTPGEKYSYSNMGYGLLALIVEKASGQTWQAYLEQHLIRRAGLARTNFYGDKRKNDSLVARGYIGPSEEELKLEAPLKQNANNPYLWGKYVIGATGITTTTGDLYKWWLALRSDRILSAAAREKKFTPQAVDQGYGWNIRGKQKEITRIHRGGLRGSFQSMLAYYPKEDTVLIFALNTNVGEGSPFWASTGWSNMEKVITGKEYTVPPAIISVNAAALQRYAGEYQLSSGGKFVVSLNKHSLSIGAEGQDAVNLLAYAHDDAPKTQSELNQASLDIINALQQGNLSQVGKAGALTEKELGELERKWKSWMATIGELKSLQTLGSTPGSRGFLRTFTRVTGTKATVVIRLLWDWEKRRLVAWADDIARPAITKFWPQGANKFVAFDFSSSKTLRLEFGLSADNRVLNIAAIKAMRVDARKVR